MVWLYQGGGLPPYQNQGTPQTGAFATLVNGVLNADQQWKAYLGCNSNVGATVSYLLQANPAGATVGVDLQTIISNAVSFANSCPVADSGPSLGSYWLDQIGVGSEFTPGSTGAPAYTWQVSSYCLVVGDEAVTASQLSCSTGGTSGSSQSMIGPLTVPEAAGVGVGGTAVAAIGVASWKGWLPKGMKRGPKTAASAAPPPPPPSS